MELNTHKVEAVLKELNDGKVTGNWGFAEGIHVLPAALLLADGNFKSGLETGVPVKLFFNKKTGEIKPYIVKMLV